MQQARQKVWQGMNNDKTWRFIEKFVMARQKKPRKTFDDSDPLTIASTDPNTIAEYLKRLSFNISRSKTKYRRNYLFIRKLMFEALTASQKIDPVFAALIERIARMTVIIDRIEKELFDGVTSMDDGEIIDKMGGNYLTYLKEYRNFIESFSNLRWAGDKIEKTRVLEKIREIKMYDDSTEKKQKKDETEEKSDDLIEKDDLCQNIENPAEENKENSQSSI